MTVGATFMPICPYLDELDILRLFVVIHKSVEETGPELLERLQQGKKSSAWCEGLTPCRETLLTSCQRGEKRAPVSWRQRGGRSTTATCEVWFWHLDRSRSAPPPFSRIQPFSFPALLFIFYIISSPFNYFVISLSLSSFTSIVCFLTFCLRFEVLTLFPVVFFSFFFFFLSTSLSRPLFASPSNLVKLPLQKKRKLQFWPSSVFL